MDYNERIIDNIRGISPKMHTAITVLFGPTINKTIKCINKDYR